MATGGGEDLGKRAPRKDYKKLHTFGTGDDLGDDLNMTDGFRRMQGLLPPEVEEDGDVSSIDSSESSDSDQKIGDSDEREGEGVTEDPEELAVGESERIRKLREQILAVEWEEKALKEQKTAEKLQRRLDEKKAAVQKLKGEKTVSDGKKGGKSKDSKLVTIDDLRKSKKLKSIVKSKLAEEGLNLFGSDESDDEDNIPEIKKKVKKGGKKTKATVFSDSEEKVKKSKGKSKKGKKKYVILTHSSSDSDDSDSDYHVKKSKSGILSKSSDKVRHKQKYPQAYLRFEHVSSKTSFESLDINLFVAGELEIISDTSVKASERMARLDLLKRLMYLSSSHEFSIIKNMYAAVLREIELGHLEWGESFQYVENSILSSCTSKKVSFTPKRFGNDKFEKVGSDKFEKFGKRRTEEAGSDEKAWFCSLYQRHKCDHKSAHTVMVKGNLRLAQHICATCYQKDKKKLEHPECSSACPYSKMQPNGK